MDGLEENEEALCFVLLLLMRSGGSGHGPDIGTTTASLHSLSLSPLSPSSHTHTHSPLFFFRCSLASALPRQQVCVCRHTTHRTHAPTKLHSVHWVKVGLPPIAPLL
jgi:hypothetical protein